MATVAAEPPRVHSDRPAKGTAPRNPRAVKPATGVARLTLEISGTAYRVRPLAVAPDSGVLHLYQLRKVEDGTIYHASRHAHGDECTCPSFVFDHDGRDNRGCKHLVALGVVGLLPPPWAGVRTTPAIEPAAPVSPASIVSPERQARFQAATAAHTPRPVRGFGEGL